ncbi:MULTISPECIES: hypothetical protein [unclassified Sphingobium]|uniref:hypothetical protein n=1 Tax=unclassified Sphingobium TaxID=2611147 RepID=UPI0005CBEC8A|nr:MULTISPECIES: hypothetical protein [unclassified Sphingobium]AJR23409.1 hypothetical protein TZ53_06330 [Sphingobium sp. YBL2]
MTHHVHHLRDGADEVLAPESSTFLAFEKLGQAVSAAPYALIACSALGDEIDFGYLIDAERRARVGRSRGSRRLR